jgi:hypothetical protein
MKFSHNAIISQSPELEEEPDLSLHAEIAELEAYHENRLPPVHMKQIQRHLVLCPECLGLLLDLVAFLEAEPQAALSEEELNAAWSMLQSSLRKDDLETMPAPRLPVWKTGG